MDIYVISDTHFNHNNICGVDGFEEGRRIFPNAELMNQKIISSFNKKVSKEDHTYHLGDIALNAKKEEIHEFLCMMNGSFEIVQGNHDNSRTMRYLNKMNFMLPCGRMKYKIHDVGIRLKANKRVYYLTHFPFLLGSNRIIYRNICGHIHGEAHLERNGINVGIDSPEVKSSSFGEPVLLSEVFELLERKFEKNESNRI